MTARAFLIRRITLLAFLITFVVTLAFSQSPPKNVKSPTPKFSDAVAFDVSPPLRSLAPAAAPATSSSAVVEVRPERGPVAQDKGYRGDAALQSTAQTSALAIPGTLANFEGLSNQDNFNIFGFRVNPGDPNGEVGPNHFVQIVNLTFAVFDKAGNKLLGPLAIGSLWSGFSVPDCTDPSGDPVVLYDQFMDRWLLSQFTTSGLNDPTKPFWNCVAVSTSGDPTGTYYRYAFETTSDGIFYFPDYPKYGNWTDSYVLTTREFEPPIEDGIGVYALEKNKMVNGDPTARSVKLFIDGHDPDLLPLVGDGMLPADPDGKQKPKTDTAIPIIGTQDDDADYGATFDALNIWDLYVKWRSTPIASLELHIQLATAPFASILPCAP